MTYSEAHDKAVSLANESGNSVLIYKSTLPSAQYGVEFTLPRFGERVGNRVYPIQRRNQKRLSSTRRLCRADPYTLSELNLRRGSATAGHY